jgi:hypothetical protein
MWPTDDAAEGHGNEFQQVIGRPAGFSPGLVTATFSSG